MEMKKGHLSIDSENIFPIIKKWVYSDHDIFFRELISNGCDAITKLKKLDLMGEYDLPEDYKAKLEVIVNPEEKSLKFIDNGLGMTADEVVEYITQIAFSGATQFLEKYKDKTTEDDMIGHFGLGFYSSFMVADEVHIDSLSYQPGAVPVHWVSEGGTEYEMQDGDKETVGTEITLYLNEDSYEFCNEYRAREVLEKYCSFMPVEIFLSKANEEVKEDAPAPVSISDTKPLWSKHPNECEKEEYIDFYRKVFLDYKEPLFWIHLNMDYPFNLKGILYFPKINTEYDSIEGVIKLYNNQVFIADNIKEVIPEFLKLLKGVIDCPDLPLNVSRSALQNDGFVNKIADYISKKVADKLNGLFKTDRENYETYWEDINPFIKYGCLRDEKFADRVNKSVLYKNLDGKYFTLEEYVTACGGSLEKVEDNEEEIKTNLYYVTDEQQQSQYIKMFKEQGQDAVILRHNIDAPFISYLESKFDTIQFMRIDADINESLKAEISEDEKESFEQTSSNLVDIFRKTLGDDTLDVKVEMLKDESIASMAVLSEEDRRMEEMMRMYGMAGMEMPGLDTKATLILNAGHPLVKFVVEHKRSKNVPIICKQLYDLAMLAHKPLSPEDMTAFVQRSNEIMMLLTK